MKLLIEKSNNKVSNIIKLEMLSTEFNSVTKLIKENEIPVVVFTDTSESYLVNNINELINYARNNTEVSLSIVLEDLISLGGNSEPVQPAYTIYKALLNQTSTNAPVATVLENTLGDVVWRRDNVGNYSFDLPDLSNKLVFIKINSGDSFNTIINGSWFDNTIYIQTIQFNLGTSNFKDELLSLTPIQIEIYDQ
jgi:hypothetical protein